MRLRFVYPAGLMARKRGRPPAPPVSTEALTDDQAFWRLKAIGLDSYQCMRVLEFCVIWQRHGCSVAAVVERAKRSRATVFNRLRDCHRAGFEPGLVQMTPVAADSWEFLEYTRVEHIKQVHREHMALPRILRMISSPEMRPEPDDEIDLAEPADPRGWLD